MNLARWTCRFEEHQTSHSCRGRVFRNFTLLLSLVSRFFSTHPFDCNGALRIQEQCLPKTCLSLQSSPASSNLTPGPGLGSQSFTWSLDKRYRDLREVRLDSLSQLRYHRQSSPRHLLVELSSSLIVECLDWTNFPPPSLPTPTLQDVAIRLQLSQD